MIELTARDGHKLYAYRADPEGSPKGAIVVLQEATGINPHVQKLADAFAAKGYVAVAPDLSGGPQSDAGSDAGLAENPDIARQLERDRAFAEIQAAVDAVKGAGKVAVVGYAWGGYLAYVSANRVKGLACAIGYYGEGIVEEYREKRKIPTLLHFGERDTTVSSADLIQFRAHRPDVSAFVYPGAGHGFSCDEREDYHHEAAKAVLDRTLFWIAQYVEGQEPIALKNAGAYAAAKVEKKKKPKAPADDMGPPAD
jgi:carboxymethylenebutenolidase